MIKAPTTKRQPRPNAAQRGYDWQWQQVAAIHKRREPLCRRCARAGRTTEVELVDHIIPLTAGGARLEESNLQSLCRNCHAVKTAEDFRVGVCEISYS